MRRVEGLRPSKPAVGSFCRCRPGRRAVIPTGRGRFIRHGGRYGSTSHRVLSPKLIDSNADRRPSHLCPIRRRFPRVLAREGAFIGPTRENQGVIIDNHPTTPYTILTPPSPPHIPVAQRSPESFMAPPRPPATVPRDGSAMVPRDSSPYSVR